MQERYDQTDKLTADVAARDAQVRELRTLVEDHRSRLQALEAATKREEERLKLQVSNLTTENERLRGDLKKNKDELTSLHAKRNLEGAPDETEVTSGNDPGSVWWWVGAAALAAIVVVAGVWWIGGQRTGASGDLANEKQAEAT